MKTSKALIILAILTGLLAVIQAGVGLFYQNGGSPFPFTTLHGQTIQMYGRGIYAYDPYFNAPILQGTDAVTLFVGVPLLILALSLYRRGSLRGGILLTSVLAYFLYRAASYVFGVAYNNLFLFYLGSFSAGLFAFLLAFHSIDLQELASRIAPNFPNRGSAILLFLSAVGLLFAWLPEVIMAAARGEVAAIASYTTEVTYAIDLGIIVPVLTLTGISLLRREKTGYLAAPILLILLAIMGLVITAQTVAQSMAGINLTIGEFIGRAGSFMVLALIAIYFIVRQLNQIREPGEASRAKLVSSQV